MLKWVHYCPLRDHAASDARTVEVPDEVSGKKDEDERKKEGGIVRSTRNAKTATPDAIMRRCFRLGVSSGGSRAWQRTAVSRSSRPSPRRGRCILMKEYRLFLTSVCSCHAFMILEWLFTGRLSLIRYALLCSLEPRLRRKFFVSTLIFHNPGVA